MCSPYLHHHTVELDDNLMFALDKFWIIIFSYLTTIEYERINLFKFRFADVLWNNIQSMEAPQTEGGERMVVDRPHNLYSIANNSISRLKSMNIGIPG